MRYAPPPGRDADAETEPWYEIVGVVPDLAMLAEDSPDGAGLYHPLAQLLAYPVYVSGDVGGDAHLFASRLRTLAESVDLVAVLQSWMDEEDAGEQRATGDYLVQALGEDRLSERPLFPAEQEGATW